MHLKNDHRPSLMSKISSAQTSRSEFRKEHSPQKQILTCPSKEFALPRPPTWNPQKEKPPVHCKLVQQCPGGRRNPYSLRVTKAERIPTRTEPGREVRCVGSSGPRSCLPPSDWTASGHPRNGRHVSSSDAW